MIEQNEKGEVLTIWFDIPNGKCWSQGIPSLNGKCVMCDNKTEDHIKRESH